MTIGEEGHPLSEGWLESSVLPASRAPPLVGLPHGTPNVCPNGQIGYKHQLRWRKRERKRVSKLD